MLYQFIDWRMGLGRHMFCGNVEEALKRLRDGNNGILPSFIRDWEDIKLFCGAFRIPLHESENVARGVLYSEIHPTITWVCKQYDVFINYINETAPELLIDPKVEASTIDRPSFLGVIEGSISNTEEKSCSDQTPRTSLTSSTLTASQNSSVTATRPRSQPPQR